VAAWPGLMLDWERWTATHSSAGDVEAELEAEGLADGLVATNASSVAVTVVLAGR
jgi:hypothetical protein